MRRHRAATAALAVVASVAVAVAGCSYTKAPEDDELDDALVEDPLVSSTTIDPASTTTSTTLPEADVDSVAIALEEIAQLESPTAMAARPGEPSALYVAQQGGQVRRIEITTRRGVTSYSVGRTVALDLSEEVVNDGEQGLLGIAFSSDGNRLYASYTGLDGRQYLVEHRMSGPAVDRRSRRDLLVIEDERPNHNGGMLAIGPDGFLYWAMGDGGGGGDPEDTGQDPSDLLGSLLRIDPDVAPEAGDVVPYAIPAGNPFAATGGQAGAPEVWAYGLRNPWRFSFDRATGDLWIGDVGQDEVEEIDFLPADGTGHSAGRGANLGWSAMEGDQPFDGGRPPQDAVAPIFTYPSDDGACSVTGGYVYRGALVPSLVGIYVFADFCEGRLRGITVRDGELNEQADLGPTVASPTSFGEDLAGELYVLSQAGPIYRIIPG